MSHWYPACLFILFETGPHFVAQIGSKFWSSCLSLLSAGITGVHHQKTKTKPKNPANPHRENAMQTYCISEDLFGFFKSILQGFQIQY
jgi:hypothetical protein